MKKSPKLFKGTATDGNNHPTKIPAVTPIKTWKYKDPNKLPLRACFISPALSEITVIVSPSLFN
jgi:hypothetical protein